MLINPEKNLSDPLELRHKLIVIRVFFYHFSNNSLIANVQLRLAFKYGTSLFILYFFFEKRGAKVFESFIKFYPT